MENNPHKGTELNNVQETWNENEKRRDDERSASNTTPQEETAPATTLDKLIQQEAHEYDNDNKENRLLGGDRASVNDLESDE